MGMTEPITSESVHRDVARLFSKGVSDGRDREPFPLPYLHEEPVGAQPRSRCSRHRLAERLAVNTRINSATAALNMLATGGPLRGSDPVCAGGERIRVISDCPLSSQADVLATVRDAILADPPPAGGVPSGREALGELLRSRGDSYACDRGALAPYFPGGPSLPKGAVGSVDLAALLPLDWQSKLTAEHLLRDPSDCRARQAELGLNEPYFDEELRSDPCAYAEYLATLEAAGMLAWDVEVLNTCAPFFVWKDEKSLRCLFDCRLCNEAFRSPPGAHLTSSERLASLECPLDSTLYGTGYDIKDYYHAIRMPKWLSSHFGLPPVRRDLLRTALEKLGVQMPEGVQGELLQPALRALPMGWNWAVALAQAIHEQLVSRHVESDQVLADKRRLPPFIDEGGDRPAVLAYIDDGSVMSTNRGRAKELHDEIAADWARQGFTLHEGKGHGPLEEFEKIGVVINGRTGQVRPKVSRRWRLHAAALEFLRRPTCNSRELEIVIGHFTSLFLLRRPLMCLFHYAYEWIQKGPAKRRELSSAVRSEIRMAVDLLPLCFANIKTCFSHVVYCSDSSETHYAVMNSQQPVALVRDVASWHEKWRFTAAPGEDDDARALSACKKLTRLRAALGMSDASVTSLEHWLRSGYGPPRHGHGLPVPSLGHTRAFLEVFSGCGRLSKELSKVGFETREFDYCNNEQDNILDDGVFMDLLLDVLEGKYSAAHFGTPCRSWSRARLPRLRDSQHLYEGVPGLGAKERAIINEGNELLRRSLVLIRVACVCGLKVSLENPLSSMLWLHAEVRAWIAEFNIAPIHTDYCQWGMPWMKPTRLAANYVEIQRLARTCQGGHVHVVLRGKGPDGAWRTTQAASYPPRLCEAWAEAIFVSHRGACDSKRSASATLDDVAEDPFREYRGWDPVFPVCSNVPPVPDELLHLNDYRLLYTQKWLSTEPIHMLEGRAMLKSIQHACRTPVCRHHRVLFLGDNMAVQLSMSKGRCKNHALLRLCRRMAAYVLGHEIYPRFRYVESARNVADGPTRPDKAPQEAGVECRHAPLREFVPAPGAEPGRIEGRGRHM